jgi:hypothetical protein
MGWASFWAIFSPARLVTLSLLQSLFDLGDNWIEPNDRFLTANYCINEIKPKKRISNFPQ